MLGRNSLTSDRALAARRPQASRSRWHRLAALAVVAACACAVPALAQPAHAAPAHATAGGGGAPAGGHPAEPGAVHGAELEASIAGQITPEARPAAPRRTLPPLPVQLQPDSYSPGNVIQRFRIAQGVSEFMVVLETSSLEGVQLRTPGGQIISADNIWRVGRWQTGRALSVISLDWAATGEWLVLAPAQVPVTVIVDPMLVPLRTPDNADVGQPTVLRWQLQASGRALDLEQLAELVVASARMTDENGGSQDLAYTYEPNGVVTLTVPPQAPGIYTIETDIWMATFGQHVMHRLTVVPEPSVQVIGRRAAPILVVRMQDAGLQRDATRAVLAVTSSEGKQEVVVGKRGVDGAFRLEVASEAMGEHPARAKVVLAIDGMTKGGQPWHAPTRQVLLGSPGVAQTRIVAQAVDARGAPRAGAPLAEDVEPGADVGSAPGAPHAGGMHSTLEAALEMLLTPGPHAPKPLHLAALAAANLVLIALLWQRHRARTRRVPADTGDAEAASGDGRAADAEAVHSGGRGPASARPDASGASTSGSSTSGSGASGGSGVSGPPNPGIHETGQPHAGDSAPGDGPLAEEDALAAIEALELDALADLADRAEATAAARGRPDVPHAELEFVVGVDGHGTPATPEAGARAAASADGPEDAHEVAYGDGRADGAEKVDAAA